MTKSSPWIVATDRQNTEVNYVRLNHLVIGHSLASFMWFQALGVDVRQYVSKTRDAIVVNVYGACGTGKIEPNLRIIIYN